MGGGWMGAMWVVGGWWLGEWVCRRVNKWVVDGWVRGWVDGCFYERLFDYVMQTFL